MASRHVEGYVTIYVDGKQRLEHRVLMERHLGRLLKPTEVVHHKDGDKANNDLSNLELLSSQTEHMDLHRLAFRSATHMECTVCHVTKPLSGFYTHRSAAFGYHPHCRDCQKAKKKLTYVPRPNEDRIRKLAELDGELRTYKDWAKDPRFGINYSTLMRRVYSGMPLKEALTQPVRQRPSGSQTPNQ